LIAPEGPGTSGVYRDGTMTSALSPAASPPTAQQVAAATRATYAVFTGSGFVISTWASRIPQVRSHLRLDPSRLGLVLFAIAAGSVIALPLSGPLVARFGSRRSVAAMAAAAAVGLGVVSVGYLVGVRLLVAGLFTLGFAIGIWDVAMNVHAAVVEQHLGHSIMSRFHAGFSLGTVAGALVGTLMVALHVPVSAHLAAAAAVVAVAVPLATRRFVPDHAGHHGAAAPPSTAPRLSGLAPGWSHAPCWSGSSSWPSPSPRGRALTGSACRSSTTTTPSPPSAP
jgi:MFS family permease